MDPFLPGDIPVMVLRYLATNHCVAAAMKFIEEMPRLNNFIPAKPANVSEITYFKHLERLSIKPGLTDMLWDYGHSKMLVDEMLDGEDEMVMHSSSETLQNKIKTVHEKLKTSAETAPSFTPLPEKVPAILPVVPVVSTSDISTNTEDVVSTSDISTNTEDVVSTSDISTNTEDYECPKCISRRLEVKTKAESGCQTEECTAVQFGLQDEIPIVFCKTLLNDSTLQQKIAQTINEHMQDPQGEQNEKIIKISTQTESEIDKFLMDFAKEFSFDDVNSISPPSEVGLLQSLGVSSASVAEIEKNLTSMFDNNVSPVGSNNACADMSIDNPGLESFTGEIIEVKTSHEGAPNDSSNTSTPSSSINTVEPPQTPAKNESRSVTDFFPPRGTTTTPIRSQKIQSIKRITPTPLSNAHINPIFNTSVLVEKKTVDLGEKSAKVSVITANLETPEWRKLKRRSIHPKIPGLAQITNNVTVLNKKDPVSVLKLGADRCETGRGSHQSSSSTSNAQSDRKRGGASSTIVVNENTSHPPSASKRKATPVKLTPEKANVYNFMHYYHENSNSKSGESSATKSTNNLCNNENDVGSSVKKTPLPSSITAKSRIANSAENEIAILPNDNSQNDVTPLQPPPPASEACSTLKTISPTALQRLIATANKVCGNTTTTGAGSNLFHNKKKSFSTPRKRNHVRNLCFATPPTLKGVNPGSEPPKGAIGPSHKRKATEDLFSAEFRSKKRLNWPDSVKKNTDDASTTTNPIIARRASDSIVTSSTTEIEVESNNQLHSEKMKNGASVLVPPQSTSINDSEPVRRVAAKQHMPTIQEESMSNASLVNVSVVEPPQVMLLPSTSYQQQVPNGAASGSLKLPQALYTVATTLSDGTIHWQYYQLQTSEDKQQEMLIPVDPPPIPEPMVFQDTQSQSQLQLQPAPLGFPDPTPIKNNSDHALLNISDITCGNDGTLITPYKLPPPPPGLTADTCFTLPSLPPTPKVVMDDNESNSNSVQSLKFDNLYPPNWWASTPLKPGLPRTPGRGSSSSSNSQSPPQPHPVKMDDGVAVNPPPPIAENYGANLQHHQQPQLSIASQTSTRSAPEKAKIYSMKELFDSPGSSSNKFQSPTQSTKPTEGVTLDLSPSIHKKGESALQHQQKAPPTSTRPAPEKAKLSPHSIANLFQFPGRNKSSNSRSSKNLPNPTQPTKSSARVAVDQPPLVAENRETNLPKPQLPVLVQAPQTSTRPVSEKAKTSTNSTAKGSSRNPGRGMSFSKLQSQLQPFKTLVDVAVNISPPIAKKCEANLQHQQQLPVSQMSTAPVAPVSQMSTAPVAPVSQMSTAPVAPVSQMPTLSVCHMPTLSDAHMSTRSAPHLSTLSAPHMPTLSAPHMPTLSAPHMPTLSAPHMPTLSAPHMPTLSAPHMPTLSAPHMTTLSAPQMSTPPIPEKVKTGASTTITSKAARTATSALDLSFLSVHSGEKSGEKSDGEISSSEDEDTGKPRKDAVTARHSPHPKNPATSHRDKRQPVLQSRSQISSKNSPSLSPQNRKKSRPQHRPSPLQPRSHIGVSLNPNLKRTHGINFQVSGREKHLTMSEQETLLSLLSLRTGSGKIDVTKKENPPRAMVIKPSADQVPVAPPKSNKHEPTTTPTPHPLIKSNGLDRLIKIVRGKNLRTQQNS